MTVFVDANRAVRVTIRPWEDGSGYGPDWSDDFYDAGSQLWDAIESIEGVDDMDLPSWVAERGLIVDDVQYPIDQANDMVNGVGDYAECGPQPDQVVDIDELDRSLFPSLPLK